MTGQVFSPDIQNRVILYTTDDGKVTADVFFVKETFWLTQKTMAELFGVNIPGISKHLKNIYASGELQEEATFSKMEIVQMEGGRQVAREIEVYNLDAVIAVGYRVNSMKDWLKQVEKFLSYTDQQILRHAGQISHAMAVAKANEGYEKYRVQQNREYASDFDRVLAKYLKGNDSL